MSKKHLAINWTDGVKITQEHFHQSNAHMTDTVRELATMLLTNHNYGLIYPIEGEKEAFSYTTEVHTQERFSIKLNYCNAITQGGHHIYYDPKLYGDFQPVASIEAKDLDSSTNIDFLLLLTINPFELVPVGEPDQHCTTHILCPKSHCIWCHKVNSTHRFYRHTISYWEKYNGGT